MIRIGDRLRIKVYGDIEANATATGNQYKSNLGFECVKVKIDKVDGDKYILVSQIMENL